MSKSLIKNCSSDTFCFSESSKSTEFNTVTNDIQAIGRENVPVVNFSNFQNKEFYLEFEGKILLFT